MKIVLDDTKRIFHYTNDPLFKEPHIEVDNAPIGDLTEYKFIDGVFHHEPILDDGVTEIIVNSVTGSLMHSSDFSKITCNELSNLTVTGTVAVPDRAFSMPLKRDDGRLILFPVNVINGAFEAVLNFPTSGQYRYTDEEANIDLPAGTFKVAPIKIDVLRKVL